MRGRGVDRESSEEVLQACGNRAGYRPLEIRPPDDAKLPHMPFLLLSPGC